MKRILLHFTLLLLLFACFSCRMVRVIEIQSYNPAPITFPPEIKSVMIVNNAAQQPDNVGHRYYSLTNTDTVIAVSADSTAFLFCMSLGKAIAESPLFDDVRICEDTLRRDSLFFQTQPFTPADVISFNAIYGIDALISLDKLSFNTALNSVDIRNTIETIEWNSIHVEIIGELRALWPGQKEVYVFPFSDTLIFRSEDIYYYVNEKFAPSDVKDAIRYFSEYMGYKMHTNFVPHWSEETRWFYTNLSSEWKRATVFAAAEKWDEAGEIWESLFEKTTQWKQKARLASNLALYYEITGNFLKAVEYAELSYNLFDEYANDENFYKNLQKLYLDNLKKRQESDLKLSEQLREE